MSPDKIKIVANVGWLSGAKVLQMAIAMLVGAWVARYLGPEQFGLLSYALAFVSLLSSFAALGLRGIVVRELVQNPDEDDRILGTTFTLKLFGGILSFGLIALFIRIMKPGDALVVALVTVIAAKAILMAFSTVDLYFQAIVQSKYVVLATTAGVLTGAGIKIVLILVEAPLIYFAVAVVLEATIASLGLVIVYLRKKASILSWRPSVAHAKNLLGESWILILSGIGVVIYLKIDQLMLGEMLGAEEVGIYSAAIKLSEASYFLPIFIAASIFPTLVKSRERDQDSYNRQLQKLYDLMMWLAIGVILVVTLSANFVVNLLYGPAYAQSADILIIHIWASIFVYFSQVFSRWLINEHLIWFSPIRQGMGALANILLNLILIPKYGGMGAAIATFVSYAMATYVIAFIAPQTRGPARMMSLALIAPLRTIVDQTRNLFAT